MGTPIKLVKGFPFGNKQQSVAWLDFRNMDDYIPASGGCTCAAGPDKRAE